MCLLREDWDSRVPGDESPSMCSDSDVVFDCTDADLLGSQYPVWSGRRDKSGRPLCLFDFAKLDSKTMAAYKKTSTDMKPLKAELKIPDSVSVEMIRAFAVYEHLTRFIMPLCTSVPGRPDHEQVITKMLCIVDISGIGLKQFWNLRGYIQDIAKLFATSYPEILSRVLVCTACKR